jgi:transposase
MPISTIGVDLSKNVFQVHGVDAAGKVLITRRLQRLGGLAFFAKLPPHRYGGLRHITLLGP